MRILNEKNEEISEESVDFSAGYLVDDEIFVMHHDAIEGNPGEFHYETVKEYENGGKDVKQVWDVEPIEPKPEWNEYEKIKRYTLYSEEELNAMKEAEEAAKKESLVPTNEDLSDGITEVSEYIAELEKRIADLEGGAEK